WRAQTRNATGQLTAEWLGNNQQTDREYDSASGLLKSIHTYDSIIRQDTQRLTVDYEPNQNVSSRTDELARVTEAFEYDHLGRLTSCRVAPLGVSPTVQAFAYDDIGNVRSRLTVQGIGEDITYSYGPRPVAGPHAVTWSSYGTYTYDEKGNQRSGPG